MSVVVGTLSLDFEPLIIVDRVVGIAARVPILDGRRVAYLEVMFEVGEVSSNAFAGHSRP